MRRACLAIEWRRLAKNLALTLLECRSLFGTLGVDESGDFIERAHRAGADFGAANGGAGVGEGADPAVIPILQQTVGEAAHESVAGAGGIDHIYFEGGNVGHFAFTGDERAVGAHGDSDNFRAEGEKFVSNFLVVGLAGNFAGGGFAGFEDVNQLESGDEIFFRAQLGVGEIAGRDVEIEDDANAGCARDFHAFDDGREGKLRGFGVKMFGRFDVFGKKSADLLGGEFAIDVGKHVDAALALGVDGNPDEGGLLALDGFNAGKIEAVLLEGFGDEAAAFVVADEAEPGGGGAEAGNLGEIVAGDAAGVNFESVGIDFFIGAEEARDDSEIIDASASDSYHLRCRRHGAPCCP